MRKTFTLLIALLALTVSSWATTVTWDGTDLSSISLNCPNVGDKFETSSIDGIIASLERNTTLEVLCDICWISICIIL